MRAINHFQILWAWGWQVCKTGSILCQVGRNNTLETGHALVLEATKPVEADCLPSVKKYLLPAWGPVRFLPDILLAADILGLHVTLLGKSMGGSRKTGHTQGHHCQGCVHIGHRELGGWQWLTAWDGPLGNRIFPRGTSSGVELVMPLGFHLVRNVKEVWWVKFEWSLFPNLPAIVNWVGKTLQGWTLRWVSQGWNSASFLSFF